MKNLTHLVSSGAKQSYLKAFSKHSIKCRISLCLSSYHAFVFFRALLELLDIMFILVYLCSGRIYSPVHKSSDFVLLYFQHRKQCLPFGMPK